MEVIYGPRRAEAGTYDVWAGVVRAFDPCFEFTDPPLRHSLQMALAFAGTADRPVAVLTGPSVVTGPDPGLIRLPRPAETCGMARVGLDHRPLTAVAALVWNSDLPPPAPADPLRDRRWRREPRAGSCDLTFATLTDSV